ncbi:MAG: thiol reductant ABC exporter subunit CydC [Solirubrobacterales bacterium]
MSSVRIVRELVELAPVGRRRFAASVALGALAIAFGVALMTTAGYLISRAAEHPDILSLTVVIVGVRFFGIGRPLIRYLDRLVSHDMALRALGRMRSRFYERIEPLAPAQLEGFRHGELLSRMVGDVDALQGLYLRGLAPPVVAILVALGTVAFAAVFLPAAAAILAAGLLLSGLAVPALAARLQRRAGGRQRGARSELTADVVELLRGTPELLVYGGAEAAFERARSRDAELATLARRDATVAGFADALVALISGATVAGVLAVAVASHDGGSLDRLMIATLALLAMSSFEATAPLPEVARESSRTIASGRRVLELTAIEPAIADPPSPEPRPLDHTVALESVTARYPGASEDTFRDLDLRIAPGERVALLGASGTGKTTIVSLLLRFLDPESGRVSVGGVDARLLRQDDLRSMFALAGQDAHLFSSTIAANLRIAAPDAGDDELAAALEAAKLGDWVRSLPEGLDTFVGEQGRELSGGQRQRLVVARALLSPAPVLLLDEPTAHLDPPTAERLLADTFAAASGRSVLLITHRPEGLDLVDRVERIGEITLSGGSPA